MALSAEFIYYLVPVAISVLIALVISVIAQRGVPSVKMFMVILAVALAVFTINGTLPEYTLGLSAVALGVVWFGGRNA